MRTEERGAGDQGLTLIELLIVLTVVAILAAIAGMSYKVYVEKAKTVEAEAAVYEVHRLQNLYHQTHSTFSSDLAALGYTPTPPLKYYTIEVQVGGGNSISYRATAKPRNAPSMDTWMLTRYEDGTTLFEKSAASAGGSAGESFRGTSPDVVPPLEDSSSFAGRNRPSDRGVTSTVPMTNDGSTRMGGAATAEGN
jgi:type IV pilus assembly protein PilE